jgi:hypothetical protein
MAQPLSGRFYFYFWYYYYSTGLPAVRWEIGTTSQKRDKAGADRRRPRLLFKSGDAGLQGPARLLFNRGRTRMPIQTDDLRVKVTPADFPRR